MCADHGSQEGGKGLLRFDYTFLCPAVNSRITIVLLEPPTPPSTDQFAGIVMKMTSCDCGRVTLPVFLIKTKLGDVPHHENNLYAGERSNVQLKVQMAMSRTEEVLCWLYLTNLIVLVGLGLIPKSSFRDEGEQRIREEEHKRALERRRRGSTSKSGLTSLRMSNKFSQCFKDNWQNIKHSKINIWQLYQDEQVGQTRSRHIDILNSESPEVVPLTSPVNGACV
ncbi:hypothetical protein JOM56_012086 [Amanita muscaria]